MRAATTVAVSQTLVSRTPAELVSSAGGGYVAGAENVSQPSLTQFAMPIFGWSVVAMTTSRSYTTS